MNVPAGEVKSNKSKRRDGYGLQLNTCFCLFRDREREREASLASPKFWRKGREKEDQEQAERKKGK